MGVYENIPKTSAKAIERQNILQIGGFVFIVHIEKIESLWQPILVIAPTLET